MMIGFVGQGYVGSAYADVMEARGASVVRYSLEEPHCRNKGRIGGADIAIIAVPTPTTPDGHDVSAVEDALGLVGDGKIAVIKSTVLPGTTRKLQAAFPSLTVLCSPEFLSAATAHRDVENPALVVVGMPSDTWQHRAAAEHVHAILPKGAKHHTCLSDEAEIIKYTHNLNGYLAVLGVNLMYEVAQRFGCDWKHGIEPALLADPYIPSVYARPVHKGGRGAGGPCFIKDIAALADLYGDAVGDTPGVRLFTAAQMKNLALLRETGKDRDEVAAVYRAALVRNVA